ncbi:MAG: radical SAM protein [Patescibacteria group bacterium]|jgi:MoaA/NifB/PqqE/SkfB family radical SAM enzyme
MVERAVSTSISTQAANLAFGKYNALYAATKPDNRSHVLQVNSIVDFDPQDPETYANGIKMIREGIPHALVRMDIDFTNACNNNCPDCFARGLREGYPGEIPYSRAENLTADLKHLGCDCVRMTGGGDPLKHPDFTDLVGLLGSNFRTLVETNGDYLCKPGYTEAIAHSAHRIRFSVDAGDNKTRSLTHRPEDSSHTYDQLVRNIDLLRKKADSITDRDSGLLIGASFIYGPQNYRLVGKFLEDMANIGVNWVQVKPALIKGKHIDDQEIVTTVLEQIEQIRSQQLKGFILHLPDRVSFDPGKEMVKCWTTQLRGFVLANSLLSICNLVRNLEVPFAKIGNVGDEDHPVQNLLFSDQGRSQINTVQQTAPKGCRYCIDKVTNITLQNMADVLTIDPDAKFQRAQVTQGENNILEGDDSNVIKITLNPKDHQTFSEGSITEF